MEGPIGDSDTDNNVLADMMEHQPDKDSGMHFGNTAVDKITISGACNVCTTPCSSCIHNERTESTMESKVEGTFRERNVKKETNTFSSANYEREHTYKCRPCDGGEHATSEGSNFSVSSTHDSSSENVESNAANNILKTCNAPKGPDMSNKVFSVETVSEGRMQIKSKEPENGNTQSLLSSAVHTNHDLHLRPISFQSEEKHDPECFLESISYSETKEANSTVHLNSDLGMKSIQCNLVPTSGLLSTNCAPLGVKTVIDAALRKSGESSHESLKQCSGFSSENCYLSQENYQTDTNSTKIGFTHSLSQIKNSSSTADDSIGIQPVIGEKKPSLTNNQLFPVTTSYAHKIEKEPSDENKNTTIDVSHAITDKLSQNKVKSENIKEKNENSANESEASQPSIEPDQLSNNSNEPDASEDDVKVCDICGDAGQEEFLANCCRCTDGAEHTYCMRIMMTKLPEGDWLCEECVLKENAENKKVVPSESSFNKSRHDFGVKGLQNIHAARERSLNSVKASSTSRKMLEIRNSNVGLPVTTTKTTAKKSLSREGSFKNSDSTNVQSVRGNNLSGSLVLGKTPTSLSLKSPNIQSRFHSPRASFSKSSFEDLKQKAKIEDVPHRIKLLSDYTKVDGKKETARTIEKVVSFKGTGTSRLNIDTTIKNQHNSQMDDSKSQIQGKKKNIFQRKNSFSSNSPRVSSSPLTSMKDLTDAHHNGKLSDLSDASIPIPNTGSEVASKETKQVKQQTFRTEKSFSPNIVLTSEDQKQCRRDPCASAIDKLCDTVPYSGLSQSSQQANRDLKKKPISLGNSRQTTSGKILKCQKCNETGHATQSCSIDKIRLTALKPSGERNMGNKTNKWKDAVEVAFSKARIHNRLSDQPLPLLSNASLRMKISDEDKLDISSHCREPSLLEGTSDKHETFGRIINNVKKITVQNEDEQNVVMPMESTSASGNGDTIIHSDALKPNASMEMLTKNSSMNLSLSKVPAIPKIPHIWKGCFEVHRSGNFNNYCDGVQAHLSTSASPKVLQVAANFPCKFQLEEACCDHSWPSQFQQKSPTEDNIALFFFATDFDSHQNYTKLVDNMLKNNLVLKGSFDGFELLIFPSNKLHERFQCWNGFYFLWGVFRGKRSNYLEKMSDFQQKHCKSSCDAVLAVSDFASSIKQSDCQKVNSSFQKRVKETFTTDIQVKMDNSLSTGLMDFEKLTSGSAGMCFDLNENTCDDISNDGSDINYHMERKRQHTSLFAESLKGNACLEELMQHSQEYHNALAKNVQTNIITNTSNENSHSYSKSMGSFSDFFKAPTTSQGPDIDSMAIRNNEIIKDIEADSIGPTISQGSSLQRGKKHSIIDFKAGLIDLPQENNMQGEIFSCHMGSSMKHTFLQESISKASGETLSKECWLLDHHKEEQKNKRLKTYHDCSNESPNYEIPERNLLSISSSSPTEYKPENHVPFPLVLLDKEASISQPNIHNFEQPLESEKEREPKKILPLFLSLADSVDPIPQDDIDVSVNNKDDDASTSLSLSLAFPPQSEISNPNSLIETKQLLPEIPNLNSPLLLFGGVIDSGRKQ